MTFQTRVSPGQSTLQKNPVRGALPVARRAARGPVRVQALGMMQSVPVIVEAMKIGFAYAAIPGAAKGAWDAKRAMAAPNPEKPVTDARKLVFNQAALYGSSGALMGLCAGVFATQFGLSPEHAWEAGTVTGLGLFALIVAGSRQLKAADGNRTDQGADKDADLTDVSASSGSVDDSEAESACDEELCDLPDDYQA